MASPIIRSVTATPSVLQVGQSTLVEVDAIDPDARTIVLNATATDSSGNTTVFSNTEVLIGDPLEFALTCSDPTVTIVQDPVLKNKFTVQV